jgi:hypothetical protein
MNRYEIALNKKPKSESKPATIKIIVNGKVIGEIKEFQPAQRHKKYEQVRDSSGKIKT